MVVKVSSLGNSLGIRIPEPVAKKFGLNAGSKVSLSLTDDAVIIKPVKKSLRDEYEAYYGKPLADITREDVGEANLVDFGEDVGGEKIEW